MLQCLLVTFKEPSGTKRLLAVCCEWHACLPVGRVFPRHLSYLNEQQNGARKPINRSLKQERFLATDILQIERETTPGFSRAPAKLPQSGRNMIFYGCWILTGF